MKEEVIEAAADDRVLVRDVMGRTVYWLFAEPDDRTPVIRSTKLHVDVLEVPRVDASRVLSPECPTIDVYAAGIAERLDLSILRMVHWPAGEFSFGPLAEAVGLVLVDKDQP